MRLPVSQACEKAGRTLDCQSYQTPTVSTKVLEEWWLQTLRILTETFRGGMERFLVIVCHCYFYESLIYKQSLRVCHRTDENTFKPGVFEGFSYGRTPTDEFHSDSRSGGPWSNCAPCPLRSAALEPWRHKAGASLFGVLEDHGRCWC